MPGPKPTQEKRFCPSGGGLAHAHRTHERSKRPAGNSPRKKKTEPTGGTKVRKENGNKTKGILGAPGASAKREICVALFFVKLYCAKEEMAVLG